MVKEVLIKKECSGTSRRWITKIQEYDLEIRTTKMVRGQGLKKMMAENNLDALQDIQVKEHVNSLFSSLENCDWYDDLVFYFKNLSCPPNFNKMQRRSLQLRDVNYFFVQGGLRWRNHDGIILHCVDLDESKEILNELHLGVCGGHFSSQTIAHKIMRS
jgi:hypothetical protein